MIEITARTPGIRTLADLLRERAEDRPDHRLYTFLADGEEEAGGLTYGELDRRARALAAWLQEAGCQGERALLLFPPGLDFVAAFFGCLYAGAAAVPVYPPRLNRVDERLEEIFRDAQPRVVLTTSALLSRLAGRPGSTVQSLWTAVDQIPDALAETWREPDLGPGDLAFLQYTSGSTASPKGVMVTHGNLLANEERIQRAFRQSEESIVVGWLPLYHDMGLIGNILQPLWSGGRCVLMSPWAFLQRPARWLEAISRYRATTSGGPNFAYDLCVRRVRPEQRAALDLSSWEVAFNGAEPVRRATLDRFAEAFAPAGFRREAFVPCYGLAEATLLVTAGRAAEASDRLDGSDRSVGLSDRLVVSCGALPEGEEVRIVDPETGREAAPGAVGEIWVAGPSVAAGYWNRPAETRETFGAMIGGDGPFLRTGDLGFARQGELFVTGRIKDLIILRGRNHYPQDLELTAERAHAALRPGGSAAFAVDGEDEELLVLAAEIERRSSAPVEEVAEAVRRAVAEEHEARVHEVVLLQPGSLPRTSSGKVQRHRARAAWLGSGLDVVAAIPAARETGEELLADDRSTLSRLRQAVARAARVDPAAVPMDRPLTGLGLDSLAAVELKHAVESDLGIDLPLSRLLGGATLDELAREIPAGPAEPEERLRVGDLPRDVFPLSYGQRSLRFLERMAPGATFWTLAGAARVHGALDPAALRWALERVVERHPALRTTFHTAEGEPVQRVHPHLPPDFLETAEEDDASLVERIDSEVFRPFDLEAGPLVRMGIFRLGKDEETPYALFLAVHHLVSDLWSIGTMMRELEAFHREARGGEPARLTPLPVTYADYVDWQCRRLAGPEGERLWDFWREQLGGDLPVLDVPTDRPRPPVQTFHGASRRLAIDTDLTAKLRALARSRGATLYVALLAAFETLLHRTSGQEDLLVGTPAAGRTARDLAGVVGYFVSPVAIRADLSGEPSFLEILARSRRTSLAAFEHQDFPFALLAERLQARRDVSRPPVFQAFFVLEQLPGVPGIGAFALGHGGARAEVAGLTLESLPLASRSAQLDLLLLAAETGDGLALTLEHNTDLFDVTTIDRMLGHLRVFLAGAVEQPDLPVGELPWLTAAECAQLFGEGPETETREAVAAACLHHLFEEQADRAPTATAAVFELEKLTYGELERRANRLARHLIRRGVGPEVPVGLCIDRSLEMVVAILAVFKAGGAYVPLDPAWPAERLAFLLADAGCAFVVGRGRELAALPTGLPVLDLDADRERIAAQSEERPTVDVRSGNLAYVIYTSGSTGLPKGVPVTHANVVRLLTATAPWFGFDERDVWTLFHSYAFDFSVWEIWGALAHGGQLAIVPREVARSSEDLYELLSTERVTVLNQVPSVFRQVVLADAADPLPLALRLVIFGGEALDPGMLRPWFDRYGDASPRLVNMYGITETTVHVTYRPVTRADLDGPSAIGRPIPDLRVHLLDRRMQPVPVGVPGEIFVSGAGLARGYLHRPDLTAERFVPDPFGAPGGRLYRSGDLARRRLGAADGLELALDLEYLGRIDHQVKVRGFRIELGEIEARLAEHPGVRAAAVVALDSAANGEADRRLAAFFVPVGEVPALAALRAHLAHTLPEPMLPAAFVALPELPRTPSGKVDRRALAAWTIALEPGGAETAVPRTPEEEIVTGLWADLLGAERVGPHEDVFEIGAHSLLVTRMAWRLRETLGVELPLRVLFEEPTPAGLARRIAAARRTGGEGPPLRPVPRPDPLPLSFAQQRLWFEDQMEPGSPLYNMAAQLDLRGALDAAALERALTEVVRRHEALRTTFPSLRGRPRQEIAAPSPVRLPRIDLAALPAERRVEEARRQALAEARRPFDLAAGPLLRGFLLRLGASESRLVLNMHHIVSDGWSVAILVEEVGALYGAFVIGQPSPLPELPVQYADFTLWQREQLAGEALESQLAWWRRRLADAPPALELPADHPRPPVRRTRGSEVPVEIGPDLAQALSRLGRREGATFFVTLLAAFQALLYRETDEEDLSVGTPFAGRARSETERLIGFFVNTLVVRTDLGGSPTFRALVARAREAVLGASAHQDLPFDRLVEELVPQRDPARTPLFQVLFALQDRAPDAAALSGLETAPVHLPAETAKTDLTLTLTGGPAGLAGWIEYSTDLFDRTTVQRFALRFGRLVRAAVENPEISVDALPLLAAEERQQVTVEWAAGTRAIDVRELRCVHELFEEQAARTPDLPAVSDGNLWLTYAELNDRADRLARHLAACGVGLERPVAVLLESSPELVVALLAILKAGGAYVPLDPAYPAERLAFLLRDSGARTLVADELPEGLVLGEGVRVVGTSLSSFESFTSFRSLASPQTLAYVIYTSGSTGLPKGVAISHENLVPLLLWSRQAFGFGEPTRVLQSLSPTFDFGLFETLTTLLFGGTLFLRGGAERGDVERTGREIRRQAVNTLHATPSYFRAVASAAGERLSTLEVLHLGGETLTEGLVEEAFVVSGEECRLFNGYGPTEATINCALFAVGRAADWSPRGRASVPIGRPSAASRLFVLDRGMQPVPVGIAGELLVGGVGLARGYLGRPDLTAERFVPDSLGEPDGRLYRTGDRARWLPDGTVEFLGRLDDQVKLRGFRIEPGEIEAALAPCPAVEQAAVLARQDVAGPRLVAYLVPANSAARDTAAVRTFLRARLPEPMIPASFVWLEALPLTGNGKLDRRALARIEAADEPAASRHGGGAAPRTPIEEGLAGIWREVLGVAAAGPDDDFFALGGHSLLAAQVVSRVRESFGVELPLRDLFARPRLADLAAHVEEERRRGAGLAAPPVTPVPRDAFPEGLPLSFSQEWMWVAGQLSPEAAAYNTSLAVRLSGVLDPGALAAALRQVARRHEVLRTRFVSNEAGPLQVPDPTLRLPVATADLAGLPPARREPEMARAITAEAARPFDLVAGSPARALLVRLDPAEHVLVIGLHHLVTDGWSAAVLLREVAALFAGIPLPDLPVQYADYALWQRRWLAGATLETLLAWWREHLAGPLPVLELPADQLTGFKAGAAGGLGERLPFQPAPAQVEAMRSIARGRGSTLFAVLLAAWKTLLARFVRQDDLVVGTPVANRTRRELEGLIGYFVNDLPLRTRLGGDPTFLELLDRVHATALGAWAHQDLPLSKIVQEVGHGAPLFRAWFQLQNMPLPSLELPGVKLSLVELEAPNATFDLELLTMEVDGGLAGHLVFNRELFHRETAAALLRSFQVLIDGIAADPGRRLSDLPLLAPEERSAVLAAHRPSGACRGEVTLHRAFEAMVAARPQAPAVTCEGVSLTYAEVNRRADILARRLRAQGVGPESRVGLRVDRSPELVIGILGVLKSGGAYVPIDPDYPRERQDLLLEDARVHVLVAREESVLTISKRGASPGLAGEVGPDHLAYVIYTSGSTGRPKGVMVTHRQAARLFEATRDFGFGLDDVWTLFHSYAFDFSVWEIWGAFLHGGRLVVVPHRVSRSPEDFLDLLAAEKVTVLNQTPSAFYQLLRAKEARTPDAPPLSLRRVIFGGEALEPSKLLPWFDRHGDAQPILVNMYGITETTVHVTQRPLTRADAESPDSVLGRPLDDLRLVLLDAAFGPVPPGAVGEILVGGGGVARGYLGRPDLTAERFVPDPFAGELGEPGARLYRSGDLARLRSDGELVYLGRADQQLKVRGFRIEPGEVEAALVRHSSVAQAAVFTRKLSAEDVRLVACIVCRADAPSSSELREHLLATLPEPWVPSLFVPVPALPLTAHGKVDRQALAELADRSDPSDPSDLSDRAATVAPLSPLEEHLATLWAGLLGIDHVERDDNFFTLGGHSLLVTWIAARVREAFGIPPPMRSFFERPTVGNLALGVLSELIARLEPGRFEEILALVEGMPEAEVARLVESKRRATVAPRVETRGYQEGRPSGTEVTRRIEHLRPSGAAAPAAPGLDPAWSEASCVRDLLDILPPPGPSEPPLRVTTLAFPTSNRPAVLERGLASQAVAAREHGRELRFAVLDDSPDPRVREEYRGRLAGLRRRYGVEISYAGREEKLRFAAALRTEGIHPEAVAATLLDPEGVGLTIGANRNAVLLQTVGEGVVSVDDDTLARGGPPPAPEPGIELLTGTVPGMAFLSAREPGAIRGFASRAEAMAAVDLRTVDLPGVHEALLGRDVTHWLREFDPEAPAVLDRADPAFLQSLESGGGRVVVTTNGWVGDCGWRSPIFYMLQTGDSWRHLVRSADFYRTVTASKEIVRFMPRPAVGNAESFMATMFCGFDNRSLLPPFPPVLWGEDLLYGLTLQLAFPTARAGHLPWVALHDPIEQRGFWPGEMVRTASGIDHSRLLSALLVDFVPDYRLAPADGLRRLGAFLQELGRMEPGAFDELARRRVRERAEAFAADLEARLADWRDEQERPEAGELWAADVRRYLDLLRRHMEDPDFAMPLDLLYHREPEEARRLAQRLLVHHGIELAHWPDLVEAVRSLKARGQSLAEVVP